MTNGEWSENLEDIYNFVYSCEKCGSKYGSDKEEKKGPHLCPFCEKKE